MANVAVFGNTNKTLELGGLTFAATPATVGEWCQLLADDETSWIVERLRERVQEEQPAAITIQWYNNVTPYNEHQAVANALLGLLEEHHSSKGKTVLRLRAGHSRDTLTICGVRFYAAVFTRAEVAEYQRLVSGDLSARAEFFAACLRRRVFGAHDPADITTDWYMSVPVPADRYLEFVLVHGTQEKPKEAQKEALTEKKRPKFNTS